MRSPFVVYVDECGDPGLRSFDPTFPVFVVCAAIYRTEEYLREECPALSAIKFEHWWHDAVVFHGYKIRKQVGQFSALTDPAKKNAFIASLTRFFAASRVKLIAVAINKPRLRDQYARPENPYHLALQFVMERTFMHLPLERNAEVMFVAEKRGAKEDARLKAVFVDIADGDNFMGHRLPFRICFADKEANITGLQVADLAAYPIARCVETGQYDRRDWTSIRRCIRASPRGEIFGYGLKIFPEKPNGIRHWPDAAAPTGISPIHFTHQHRPASKKVKVSLHLQQCVIHPSSLQMGPGRIKHALLPTAYCLPLTSPLAGPTD